MQRPWRRLALTVGVLGALLVLYVLAGFMLLPRIVRHELLAYGERLPGSHLDVGAVRFNPFTLTAQIDDLTLRRAASMAPAADSPMIGFRSLTVTINPASLWQWAWDIRRIALERPTAQLLIGADGALESPLVASTSAGPGRGSPAASPSGAGAPPAWPRFTLERFEMRAGALRLVDLSRGPPMRLSLDPLDLALADLRTAPGSEGSYRFGAVTGAGEHLDWSGRFSLRPATSSGQFTVQGLKMATLKPYLPASMPLTAQGGRIDLHGDYQWSAAPESLLLHLADLTLRGSALVAGGGAPLVTLPELDVSDATLTLPQQRLAIAAVRIRAPAVQARRGPDGQIDLLRLVSGDSAGGDSSSAAGGQSASTVIPAATAAPAAQPWSLQLARVAIEGATLQLEDDSVQPTATWRVQPLSLTVQGYSSVPSAPLTLSLDAGLGRTGRLTAQASVIRSPLQASGQLDLQGFNLSMLQPYVRQRVALTIYRGQLGAQAVIHYASSPAKGQPHVALTGSLSAANFATRDDALRTDFLTGTLVLLSGVRYQQDPDALNVQRVLARGVYGRVLIGSDGSSNLSKILAPLRAPAAAPARAGTSAAASVAGSNAAAPAMPIRIARVDVQNGSADFTDRTVQPNFSSAILGLHGSVIGLSSDPQSRASVNLQGSVNRYAPVSIVGQVNPLAATTYTDVTMRFQNIELTTFNPYSGKFAGYSIAQGKLSTQMHYHIDHGRLDATHHIEIDQLEFGPATARKQAVPLPVKLAAALLKDRHGVISIDLPVSGTLDDPKFRIGPIIWKAFVGLITKVVTAPFAWLGSLFGGGQQLAYVDFTPGSAALAPDQAHKLAQLAQALVARPQLALNIPLHTESDLDDRAFAQATFQQALQTASTSAAATDQAAAGKRHRPRRGDESGDVGSGSNAAASPDPNRAMELLYRQHFHAAPNYPQDIADPAARGTWLEQQLLPAFMPARAERDGLARARAEAAEAAVLTNHGVSPSRVFLVQRVSGGGPNGAVRMELQLQ